MDYFSRARTTHWAILLLVLVNLGLLLTFWYSRLTPDKTEPIIEKTTPQGQDFSRDDSGRQPVAGPPDRPGTTGKDRHGQQMAGFLKRELDFSQQQVNQFLEMRKNHRQKRESLRNEVDELRKEMMEHLLDENPDEKKIKEITEQMGQKVAELESSVFFHLQELSRMGNEQQQKKYKLLLREILEQMRPPEHRGRPGRRGSPDRRGPPDQQRPPDRQRPGQMQKGDPSLRILAELQQQMQLTTRQVQQIRTILQESFKQLQQIPHNSQYREHRQRRAAAEQVFEDMEKAIRALLTAEQLKQFNGIPRNRDHGPMPR